METALDRLVQLEDVTIEIKKIDSVIHVSYKNAKVIVHELLCDAFDACGTGKTVDEAAENYIKIISGKKIVFDADGKNRKEVIVLL